MKDTLLVRVLIILILVVGIAVLFVLGGNSSQNTFNNTNPTSEVNTKVSTKTTTTTKVAPISGMQTSLGGIFSEKGSYECDYDSVTPQSRSSNVVYISAGKMRGEFRTTAATGISTANIAVYDGSYLYVWAEGSSKGKVSQPKTLADLPGIIPQDVSSGRILGSGLNNVSWNCHAWSKISSLLAKPSYVSFQ